MLMIMCYYQHLSVSKNVFKFVNSLHLCEQFASKWDIKFNPVNHVCDKKNP